MTDSSNLLQHVNIPHLPVRRPMPQTARPYSMRLPRETASKNCIVVVSLFSNNVQSNHYRPRWSHDVEIVSVSDMSQALGGGTPLVDSLRKASNAGFNFLCWPWLLNKHLMCCWFAKLWSSCNVTVRDSMLHLNKVQLHHIAFIWFISFSTRVFCLYNLIGSDAYTVH